jgi:hypothetical protein
MVIARRAARATTAKPSPIPAAGDDARAT